MFVVGYRFNGGFRWWAHNVWVIDIDEATPMPYDMAIVIANTVGGFVVAIENIKWYRRP